MCRIIYEFPDYKLMLCPVEKNITANSTTNPVNSVGEHNNTSKENASTASPVNSTTNTSKENASSTSKENASSTDSNLTNIVHTPSPFGSPSPSFRSPSPFSGSPSPSYSNGSTLSHCHCDCSLPSGTPSPSSSEADGEDVSTLPDLNWLHVLWCLPLFLIAYLCYKRHCCSSIQVGIARRRYEMQMRSKSWPRRVRTPHPGATKRSKSENFETIVL